MAQNLVLVDRVDDGIVKITLNRPEKRNAMNRAAQLALKEALHSCAGEARVVILTGSGPAFCAGVDLKEQKEREEQGARDREFAHGGNLWLETNLAITRHPAIVIAAVNGYALGGGVTLINSCDLAIAADEAEIGMPEVSFGAYPALSGPSTQLRLLRKHAAWLVLTTWRIDGRTAERWGLVNKSVPRSQLMEEAEKLARHIAQFDPITLDWTKRALNAIPDQIHDYPLALEFGALVGSKIRSTTSAVREGLRRFAAGERSVGQGSGASSPPATG